MKAIFTIIMAMVSCVMTVSVSCAAARNFTVLSPPDRAAVEGAAISVVVRIESKDSDEIRVSAGDRRQSLTRKPGDRIFVCFEGLRLSPGPNQLRVTGLKEGKTIEEIKYQLFYRSNLSAEANSTPSGYAQYYFHTRDHEKECTSCHQLDFAGAPENPSSPEQSHCFICHKKMTRNYRQVHGPAAVWSCTICHELKGAGRKLATPKPDEKVCRACHENNWKTKKFMHGPTAAGECATCHNPHASDEAYFLRLETGDLCVACHEEVASRPHVISGFSGVQGHPVRRSPDPFNPGRDFTCASCHNPHASDYSDLLRSDNSSMSRFCQTCHRM